MQYIIFWDYKILSILALSLLTIYTFAGSLKRHWDYDSKNQKILKFSIEAFFVLLFLTVFYGSFIEPQWIQTKQIDINLNNTNRTESIKIVQLTDTHAGPYKGPGYFKRVAKKIAVINPDIILMTGDYVLGAAKNIEYLTPLKEITTAYPTYAISGNHEYNLGFEQDFYDGKTIDKTATIKEFFQSINVNFIDNQTKLINTKQGPLYVSGIREIWYEPNSVDNELNRMGGSISTSQPHILLAHNPEVILKPASEKFDLVLSGHTHGGQIRLPFIGSLSSLPTKLGRKFDMGLFQLDKNQLYISKGLGESGPRARLFCRPELTVLNINL
ncbi:hypothetical protein COT97_02245 [Candidatus Falkowbacteria bacterium CG10_big_fil_rev_8_21_14_0_10_39_11]|uniref:Calcineurin-like phosphoesterase domain-containing protein n=1 Tax=Candidatus Falkowbacteria bacterium CG10_big_fil_rev_8_21_14_0_10_39_11 TaxID=1974565 RepID=A0A2H0V5B3_9BACT|nr:MAG: hypothetical protein COT97_02245 [Candidatus Falkowbacteria bacterium CG10_big_fil_rev_8_21_14_0_10_39_11]